MFKHTHAHILWPYANRHNRAPTLTVHHHSCIGFKCTRDDILLFIPPVCSLNIECSQHTHTLTKESTHVQCMLATNEPPIPVRRQNTPPISARPVHLCPSCRSLVRCSVCVCVCVCSRVCREREHNGQKVYTHANRNTCTTLTHTHAGTQAGACWILKLTRNTPKTLRPRAFAVCVLSLLYPNPTFLPFRHPCDLFAHTHTRARRDTH